MEKNDFIERRRYVRCPVEAKVTFQFTEKGQEQPSFGTVKAISKDLSVEGICFISNKQVPPSSRLKLEIVLSPDQQPVKLEGDVKWSRPVSPQKGQELFSTGVRLFTVGSEDDSRFVQYICKKMVENAKYWVIEEEKD